MKKIRINELARELEVKAHEILDLLPELGVAEKKTHSSSIDEDVAIKLRRRYGFPDQGSASDGDGGGDGDSESSTSTVDLHEEGRAGSDGLAAAPVPAA